MSRLVDNLAIKYNYVFTRNLTPHTIVPKLAEVLVMRMGRKVTIHRKPLSFWMMQSWMNLRSWQLTC